VLIYKNINGECFWKVIKARLRVNVALERAVVWEREDIIAYLKSIKVDKELKLNNQLF